jgi:hypothetical protein
MKSSKGRFAFSRTSLPPPRGSAGRRGAMRATLTAAVLTGLVLGVIAPAGQASQDFVKGSARHLGADPPFPVIRVHVNAFSDATGLNPGGDLSVDAENIHSYSGNVTCLSVLGNQASIGIQIVKSSDPALVGQGELWSIEDDSPDRIAGYEITPTPPVLCPSLAFNVPVVSGNYRVNDATS